MAVALRALLLALLHACWRADGLVGPRSPRPSRPLRFQEDPPPPPEREESLGGAWDAAMANGKEIAARFVAPRVDDEGLVIADALVAGVVAPGLEILVGTALGVPLPRWAYALGPQRRVLPVLARGAAEAACWYGGACAARLYERPSFDFPPPEGADDRYRVTVGRVVAGGCFATALLIGATQLQLALVYGFDPPRIGDAPETDAVLLRTLDDLLRDIFTEATTLLAWRVVRTSLSRLD